MSHPQIGEPLTAPELDVLRRGANGQTNATMARALHVSDYTINSRWKSIFDKLGVSSRGHAIALALRVGILRPGDVDASRFLNAIRDRARTAETALQTIRQLHRPSGDPGRQVCPTCSRPGLLAPWPCKTARALDTTEAAA
ncbi:LuxR C-terminal-related transcriptional regulator [Kitasatospora aureofaciens]|uniref:response regulator transcription factor n=1 Tax=Kitasatospora aureofaciens TaxID=1894 RepID=UPI001C4884D6|nr:LuxR C-terminal-related transcriptional regulator [Kitasatospora aureofaciens]MBV6697471.1 LuxR C-terminal-related transcriptional regulator [Kitasatospora aureofaciens]